MNKSNINHTPMRVYNDYLPTHSRILGELESRDLLSGWKGTAYIHGLPINHHHSWLLCYPGNIQSVSVVSDTPTRPTIE